VAADRGSPVPPVAATDGELVLVLSDGGNCALVQVVSDGGNGVPLLTAADRELVQALSDHAGSDGPTPSNRAGSDGTGSGADRRGFSLMVSPPPSIDPVTRP
jgi:hypothetical protein